jgi:hypothetical protein
MARERTRASSFDELAVGLSSGTLSRGKAIKLMGAALVGGVLASIPGIAEAAPPLKFPGRKCKRDNQCATQLCLSGVCAGLGACRRRKCPEGCSCGVLADGSKPCIPSRGYTVLSSCACGTDELCFEIGPGDFVCAPRCTAG